ncbi:MAG: GTPase Era [Bacteroidia bacterium]|nr:GTPase Era [Bacteroidia bacterium]
MTRAGFIALLGFPNAGKSTLLNRLVGYPLSAITPKPQTTRFSIPAILTTSDTQYIFIDTPGWIAHPKNMWHRALMHQSLSAARDSDVQVWVLSLTQNELALPEPIETLAQNLPYLLGAFSHGDKLSPPDRAKQIAYIQDALSRFPFKGWTDASLDQPLDPFLKLVASGLPTSPFLYPEGDITILPLRFFVGEILREVLYRHLHEEIPYGAEVQVSQYSEKEDRDYIAATIYVEKDSHKKILIGQNGQMIKKIGTEARMKIEGLLGKPIYLDLYVKVAPKWRRSPRLLRSLGYGTS